MESPRYVIRGETNEFIELPPITTPRVVQGANLPTPQEQPKAVSTPRVLQGVNLPNLPVPLEPAKAVYTKPAKPVTGSQSGKRQRRKKTRSPVRAGHDQIHEKDEKEKKVKKPKRKQGKSAPRKVGGKADNITWNASLPIPISNGEAAVWRSRVDENIQKAKKKMTEAALHRLEVARKASEQQRARAHAHAEKLQRLQHECTQLPDQSGEESQEIDEPTGDAHHQLGHFQRHSIENRLGSKDDAHHHSDEDSRPASVFGKVNFSTDKETRMQNLTLKSKIYNKMIKKQKLVEEQQRVFDELPKGTQDLMMEVFDRGRKPGELVSRLAELGIKGKDEEEVDSISELCDAYLAAGEDDLLTFAVDLFVPARLRLQEPYTALCRDAFNAVPKFGFNTGLDEGHVLEILHGMYVSKVGGSDLSMMKRELSARFAKFVDPDTGKIECEDFCDSMWHVREAYDRECAERDHDIMEKYGIDAFSDDVKNVKEELLALHSVLSQQKTGEGEVRFDVVDVRGIVGILTESGLLAGDQEEIDFIEDKIDLFSSQKDNADGGYLTFHDLRSLIEQIRARALEKRRARDLPVFKQYDREQVGVLSLQEASNFMKDLGLLPRSKEDQDELKWLLEEADADKSGDIDFSEFQYLIQKVQQKLRATQRRRESYIAERLKYTAEELSQLREAYFALDQQRSLGIDIHGCRQALTLMRKPMSSETLNELFKTFDRHGFGFLQFEEFLFFVTAVDKPTVDWKAAWRHFIEHEIV